MDAGYKLGMSDAEQVVIHHPLRLQALDHRAHRAVKDQRPTAENPLQGFCCV